MSPCEWAASRVGRAETRGSRALWLRGGGRRGARARAPRRAGCSQRDQRDAMPCPAQPISTRPAKQPASLTCVRVFLALSAVPPQALPPPIPPNHPNPCPPNGRPPPTRAFDADPRPVRVEALVDGDTRVERGQRPAQRARDLGGLGDVHRVGQGRGQELPAPPLAAPLGLLVAPHRALLHGDPLGVGQLLADGRARDGRAEVLPPVRVAQQLAHRRGLGVVERLPVVAHGAEVVRLARARLQPVQQHLYAAPRPRVADQAQPIALACRWESRGVTRCVCGWVGGGGDVCL